MSKYILKNFRRGEFRDAVLLAMYISQADIEKLENLQGEWLGKNVGEFRIPWEDIE